MALFNGEGFNELLSDLKTNGDMLDVAAPEILEAGAAVVADAWRDAIKAHDLIDSGDMLESVGHSEIVNTETEKRLPLSARTRSQRRSQCGKGFCQSLRSVTPKSNAFR